jgi:CRISPR/Cas system CSM-associated protein Csm3 (group 7 of RAMP superfamily)
MPDFDHVELTITLESQYHIGSGYGLARVIDSMLWVDTDGVPILPGSTVSGNVGQSLYDILRFKYFETQWNDVCDFHKSNTAEPRLPCALLDDKRENPCLLCYFMGSSADQGVIDWVDFPAVSDPQLLRSLLKSKEYTPEEREQYIKPYASHKQDMRTRTVMERHFFVQEEGAALTFRETLFFKKPVPEHKAIFLAAAMSNTRALGRRKSRGKGVCALNAFFCTEDDKTRLDLKKLVQKI